MLGGEKKKKEEEGIIIIIDLAKRVAFSRYSQLVPASYKYKIDGRDNHFLHEEILRKKDQSQTARIWRHKVE